MSTTLSNSIIHLLKPISLIPLLLLLLLLLDPVSVCGQNNTLFSPERLGPGASLRNGVYSLVLQPTCNLILYNGSEAIWSTETDGRGFNCSCIMQRDGNVVVYLPKGLPIWASNTGQRYAGNYALVLQNDGKLIIYAAEWPLTKEIVNSNGANDTMAGQNDTDTKAEPLFSIVD